MVRFILDHWERSAAGSLGRDCGWGTSGWSWISGAGPKRGIACVKVGSRPRRVHLGNACCIGHWGAEV